MTKNDLITKAQEILKVYPKKDIAYAVKIIFESMVEALKNEERIEVRGFGNFTIRERKSRIARNPKSGAKVKLADRKVPFFKTGKELRLMVSDKK
jgi:integration host factor beta subunit